MQINHDSETSSKNIICNTEVEVMTWKIVVSHIKVENKLETSKLKDFSWKDNLKIKSSNIKVEYLLEVNKFKYWKWKTFY